MTLINEIIFGTGIAGALMLVAGAAYPWEGSKTHPVKSVKNWLLALGAMIMLIYAGLNYYYGIGSIFFVFLQLFIVIASILMMMKTNDIFDFTVLTIFSIVLIIWSLYLFKDYSTILFIVGLTGVGFGYAFEVGSMRRAVSLTVGSAMITVFSYLEGNMIFFGLNFFFALFSGFYVLKMLKKKN
jgi:hypothetical protein